MYYYIDQNNKQCGPVPANELVAHGITTVSYVWKEGMKDWMQVKDVNELSDIFSQRMESSFYKRPIPVTHGDMNSKEASTTPVPTPKSIFQRYHRFYKPLLIIALLIIIAAVALSIYKL